MLFCYCLDEEMKLMKHTLSCSICQKRICQFSEDHVCLPEDKRFYHASCLKDNTNRAQRFEIKCGYFWCRWREIDRLEDYYQDSEGRNFCSISCSLQDAEHPTSERTHAALKTIPRLEVPDKIPSKIPKLEVEKDSS